MALKEAEQLLSTSLDLHRRNIIERLEYETL